MFSLTGKVALVTGASQGIGRNTALALAVAGAKVAVAARNEEKLTSLVAEIVAAGGEAIGPAADLQLSAALPVARYVEYLTPTPYIDELITTPFKPDAEGFLHIPEKPGLGIELNREALKRYGK